MAFVYDFFVENKVSQLTNYYRATTNMYIIISSSYVGNKENMVLSNDEFIFYIHCHCVFPQNT